MWEIWIDTGGTFTDCLAKSPEGEVKRLKILSSSKLRGTINYCISSTFLDTKFNWEVDQDIFEGFELKVLGTPFKSKVKTINVKNGQIELDSPIDLPDNANEFEISSGEEVPVLAARLLTKTGISDSFPEIEMRLGSTRGTNALLEQKGADVIFLTTAGFRDLLTIGDQQRPDLFALDIKKPAPLYKSVIEVNERIDASGGILTELTEAEMSKISDRLSKISKSTAIAIAFLNSYKNSSHEQKIVSAIRSLGFEHVSYSTELSNVIKILPRAETTVANSYLLPIIRAYINGIQEKIPNGKIKVMTSSGAVVSSQKFYPKDSLLSGPAGGIVGAASIGERSKKSKLLTFDMGGTSTDVALYNEDYDYTYETKVGNARIQSPCLSIETIAAGGGSICHFDGDLLLVGPHSAGASPGPACYGANGPLTITDLNLLSGKLVSSAFSIPISTQDSEEAINQVLTNIKEQKGNDYTKEELITSFLQIANEKMAEAIKKVSIQKGNNPADFTLTSYGGAGGQHACALANLLNIDEILVPYDAGLLSAYGISQADIETFSEKQILKSLKGAESKMASWWLELQHYGVQKMLSEGYRENQIFIKKKFAYLRFKGQESTLEIDLTNGGDIKEKFKSAYERVYGHWLKDHLIEVESIKLITAIKSNFGPLNEQTPKFYTPKPSSNQKSFSNGSWKSTQVYIWEDLKPGAVVNERSIIVSKNTTVYIEDGWEFSINGYYDGVITRSQKTSLQEAASEEAIIELFKNRFISVVEEMGALLQRTSFSVNVKERLDFSCTLLDSNGILIANAPHIPVHLGSMGICVRKVMKEVNMNEGDVVVTNHPAFGGSHLPDITLISPVFWEGQLIGYVANRAHHSEIGGKTPGSMPPDATSLEEEGIIIHPQFLLKNGKAQWESIRVLLKSAKYPSRNVEENIADLEGAVASIKAGIDSLQTLCKLYSIRNVKHYMSALTQYVGDKIEEKIKPFIGKKFNATEKLDDGSLLKVSIIFSKEKTVFDFSGSSNTHHGNLNATEAIVQSVVLYALRLLADTNIPLNEGLMNKVSILNPRGMLNPDFSQEIAPAVVGGNTEVSQRLSDTILKALKLAACSQGTMNNLLFGNDKFGYYETICGGTGAGHNFNGQDAVHQHMTNTRITDPEILELRYPVMLNRFEVRQGSGGDGKYKGGEGIIRVFKMLDKLKVTLLTQHRKETPYGLKGGSNGKKGEQCLVTSKGQTKELEGITSLLVEKGDTLVIKTPGGGGYGTRNV